MAATRSLIWPLLAATAVAATVLECVLVVSLLVLSILVLDEESDSVSGVVVIAASAGTTEVGFVTSSSDITTPALSGITTGCTRRPYERHQTLYNPFVKLDMKLTHTSKTVSRSIQIPTVTEAKIIAAIVAGTFFIVNMLDTYGGGVKANA